MKILRKLAPGARAPVRHLFSAGWDVFSTEDVVIPVGGLRRVGTGLSVALPPGWEMQVRARSGLSSLGLLVTNSPGTVDEDYRGEVLVSFVNVGPKPVEIERGRAIAQLLFSLQPVVEWVDVTSLPETRRGEGGFGSSDPGSDPGLVIL
jgi:dUTP pyrophosphatase